MRISDWSSDVCSSDLSSETGHRRRRRNARQPQRRYSRGKRLSDTPDDDASLRKLVLYVAGQTPKSLAAISNLKHICSEHPEMGYVVEVVDLRQNPALAREHDIVAIPTLVRQLPVPIRKIIGDLSDTAKRSEEHTSELQTLIRTS